MSVDSTHPDYDAKLADWNLMQDTYSGSRTVKDQSLVYLPATGGQVQDGMNSTTDLGWTTYKAYRDRAIFPEYVTQAVQTLVGVMHREPAVIRLPAALEPMRRRATRKGESLQMLLRRINEQQLVYGRLGLLVDFPQSSGVTRGANVPHLVQYQAKTILNWDSQRLTEFGINELNFLVLAEPTRTREEGAYDWIEQTFYRVCTLEARNPEAPPSPSNPMIYKTFVVEEDVEGPIIAPTFRGSALDKIPFEFIGSTDLNPSPSEIPLLGLSSLALAIYRGEADYRQALHLLGQDTLVTYGNILGADGQDKDEGQAVRIGAGAHIQMQSGDGTSAEFIGIDSKGVPEQRAGLEALRKEAVSLGARLLEPRGTQAESGEALRIRVYGATANLHSVALTGAAGLEASLRTCAEWVGADPDEVEVSPNMDFVQETVDAEQVRAMGEAHKTGVPISNYSIHRWLRDNNITKFDSLEEELAQMAKEAPVAIETPAEEPLEIPIPIEEEEA